ncbi:uncharacterized protein LOC144911774 [Branchiostoma floridae x Branchiostoma belcheri]
MSWISELTLPQVHHSHLITGGFVVVSGIAAYSTYKLVTLKSHHQREAQKENVYETAKLLNEYLLFHFGSPEEVLQFDFGPKDALENFPKRCAEECLAHALDGADIPSRALDIGCATGRSSFELARRYREVVGIDFSHSFVAACEQLKVAGTIDYNRQDEGDLTTQLKAVVDPTIDRTRTRFQQGDACNLPLDLGQFGCVLAANLICRLPTPFDFLNRLKSLVAPGGVLVITSPYTWLAEFTPKSTWLGGYKDKDGKEVKGFQTLQNSLGGSFDLVTHKDMPFLIRETARKNQWTVAHCTVWRRKKE